MSTLAADHADAALVARLIAGDEVAFRDLVRAHHGSLVRIARDFVSTQAAAEDVAQETWLAVIRGIERFEGRSSLKSWIFSILVNQARTRGVKDDRVVPISSLPGDDGPAVDPGRFLGASGEWPGHWAEPLHHPDEVPHEAIESRETRAEIRVAIDTLPPNQQRVIVLRDVQGFSAEEVCALLELSEANQRVLLHRARSKVRAALERRIEASVA